VIVTEVTEEVTSVIVTGTDRKVVDPIHQRMSERPDGKQVVGRYRCRWVGSTGATAGALCKV